MKLSAEQLEAINRCTNIDVKSRTVPVSGAAGTGKTTIIKQVYESLVEAGHSVTLCAPTGKAAKRIEEATGLPAVTIHRLLEYPHPGEKDPKTGKALNISEPKRNKNLGNPLHYNVVLVDEYAMVSWSVHRALMNALPFGGCIRMFGDTNQLSPIELGADKLSTETAFEAMMRDFNGVVLSQVFRQGEESGILSNANRILRGQMPSRRHDFDIKVTHDPFSVLRQHMEEDGVDYSKPEQQMITLQRVKDCGTHRFNAFMQQYYQKGKSAKDFINVPRAPWDKAYPVHLAVGDKVIWTQNNYDLEIMNGETGFVREIKEGGAYIEIDFGDRIVEVPDNMEIHTDRGKMWVDPRTQLELAYAITTHKSQGSEYKRVCYLMHSSAIMLQQRGNFYTAVTRAREYVTLITDQRSLSNSLSRTVSISDQRNRNKKASVNMNPQTVGVINL